MKIAVMAGTPVDTDMGVSLLYKNGYNEIIDIPISKTPSEQTLFQVSNMGYKEKMISNHIDNIKEQGCNTLLVYCNSLSSSVDFEELGREKNIRIITPLNIYTEIAGHYKRLAVISANAQGLAGIEKTLFNKNGNIEIIGVTLLEMVKEIEKKTAPEEIAEKFDFSALANYLEKMGAEAVVLGCTHFPYIEEELKKRTGITVLDPDSTSLLSALSTVDM